MSPCYNELTPHKVFFQRALRFLTSRSISRSSRRLPLPAILRPRICSTWSASFFGIATGPTWFRSPLCLPPAKIDTVTELDVAVLDRGRVVLVAFDEDDVDEDSS